MPRVSSANAATLAARYLVEALKQPTPNAPFATINDTHHTALRNLAEIFNVISKVENNKQQTGTMEGEAR